MTDLAGKACVPCRGGVPPMEPDQIIAFLAQVVGWTAPRDHHLTKSFKFPNFVDALAFTNRVGAVAEEQNHHPDIHLAWGHVRVDIWTHKIDGLTESDFIFAAKVDAVR